MGFNRQESEQFLQSGEQPLPVLFVEGMFASEFTGLPLKLSLGTDGYPVYLLNQLFPMNFFGFGMKNAVARRVHEINRDHNGPVAIVGHSYGVKFALDALEKYPDEVAGVIAVAGVVNNPLDILTPWVNNHNTTHTDSPHNRQTIGITTPFDGVLPPFVTRSNNFTEQHLIWSLPLPIAHQGIIFHLQTHQIIKDSLREMTREVRSRQAGQSQPDIARAG